MRRVDVVIEGRLHTYSLGEARELILKLPAGIAAAQGRPFMEPPIITDGNLTRASLIRFFEQVYPTNRATQSEVGRLLGRLVAAANRPGNPTDPSYDGIPFEIVHAKCGLHVRERGCSTPVRADRPHHYAYTQPKEYRIDVASLTDHAPEFIRRHAGKPAAKNMSLLLEHL